MNVEGLIESVKYVYNFTELFWYLLVNTTPIKFEGIKNMV
jgi:hypothetical protein